MSAEPLYRAEQQEPAYHLRYTWTCWPSGERFSEPAVAGNHGGSCAGLGKRRSASAGGVLVGREHPDRFQHETQRIARAAGGPRQRATAVCTAHHRPAAGVQPEAGRAHRSATIGASRSRPTSRRRSTKGCLLILDTPTRCASLRSSTRTSICLNRTNRPEAVLVQPAPGAGRGATSARL